MENVWLLTNNEYLYCGFSDSVKMIEFIEKLCKKDNSTFKIIENHPDEKIFEITVLEEDFSYELYACLMPINPTY